jgi:hypothetical protein
MKHQSLALLISATLLQPCVAISSEMVWGYKSPSFHYGNGYSTHVLTLEQLTHNRKEEIRKAAKAEAERIERELENSTLNKFIKNVESRIYATLSKQMVDAMFAECSTNCATSGETVIEDSTIAWLKDTTTGTITLTITNEDGTVTTISVPGSGEFNF